MGDAGAGTSGRHRAADLAPRHRAARARAPAGRARDRRLLRADSPSATRPRPGRAGCSPPPTATRRAADAEVQSWKPGGGTDAYDALKLAFDMAEHSMGRRAADRQRLSTRCSCSPTARPPTAPCATRTCCSSMSPSATTRSSSASTASRSPATRCAATSSSGSRRWVAAATSEAGAGQVGGRSVAARSGDRARFAAPRKSRTRCARDRGGSDEPGPRTSAATLLPAVRAGTLQPRSASLREELRPPLARPT